MEWPGGVAHAAVFVVSCSLRQVVKPEVGFGVFADPDQPRTAV